MRIDASLPSYSSPRPGSAVTPYREAQREVEARRELPAPPAATQGFEQTAQARRVQASSAGSDSLPARPQNLGYQQALSSRAAQAIASYSSTATFANESDAQQVLGLDLYA